MALQRPVPLKWWGASMDVLLGFVVFFLFGWMIIHSIQSQVHFGANPASPPGADDIATYWVIAGLLLALQGFGLVLGLIHDRKPAIIVYPFLLIASVGIILLFAVPRIESHPADIHPANPGYCSRTDSENCPGG